MANKKVRKTKDVACLRTYLSQKYQDNTNLGLLKPEKPKFSEMSYYVYGSGLSYNAYLQAKSFVDDIAMASHGAGQSISMEISRQTREVLASANSLACENIRIAEAYSNRVVNTLSEGFDRLSYDLHEISSGISELKATFHWGFGQLFAGIGHVNDSLSELIKIAKTPIQTVAFNHFEIARDAFRQGLFQEALEELNRAIYGDHSSAGYKLEWRFHQLTGLIRLGFVDCDQTLIDLKQAETSFLLSARYAKMDYPEDAGRAFLAAGWAAYCQGKMKDALTHTEQAIVLLPKCGEAFFQAAKIRVALGEIDMALRLLGNAIELDRFYTLKAASDGDFRKYDDALRIFFETFRQQKYKQFSSPSSKMRTDLGSIEALYYSLGYWPEEVKGIESNRIEAFFKEGAQWPLLDILAIVQQIDAVIAAIDKHYTRKI